MFFEPLRNIVTNLINQKKVIFKNTISQSNNLQIEILDLNRYDQLFDKGINSEGVRLDEVGGGYASFTIDYKQSKGQPTDRITLKDSGDFYNSFKIKVSTDYLEILADTIKPTSNLLDDWGVDILGLTDQSKEKLSKLMIPLMIEQFKQNI